MSDGARRRYWTLAYSQTGSYIEAARRLNMDRRTLRSRVKEEATED